MYTILTNYKSIDIQQWADFVANHPFGNIFHTPEIVELYEVTEKQKPIVVACFDERNQLKGILVAVVQKEFNGIMGNLTARAIVWGGPVVENNDPEVTRMIIAAFNKLCTKKVVYSQFRNLWDNKLLNSLFTQQGYKFEEHLDILFDLKQGEEFLWKNIHPTRRKQINRGQKRDVQTKVVDIISPDELSVCFKILKQVYTEVKLPYPSIDFFNNAFRLLNPKGYVKTVLAYYNNEIIGFRFYLCYHGLLYDWYAGSMASHYDKYPNDILPWEILKWGSKSGYNTFDFGGAGKPGIPYGVRDYKLKFGGKLVNFGRFEKVHKPLLMVAAKMGFKIWKKL